ncbi:hypothetical protein G9F32_14100 [Acinetobacter sp. 194]|uniref:NF045616 family extracytoplasmic (lipo)protein n=1 Tax=Acinetobacter shaoyimingii TaxID=2715164 RepID=UPI00140892D1|nr:NF045616 family extracytoplasmic (lipo)protein [Acinetobacter shaoyimingii]NHB59137.1 hypothetical protein [Acinetobacter shaoyimingii]
MNIIFSLLFMTFSISAIASPESKLYVEIKNDDICIYTNDPKSDYYNGRIYLYMGEVHTELAYQSSYNATYHHIKIPKSFADCIAIKNSNFKHNIPYDINLDMNKAYSQRICVSKPNGKIQLTKVVDGYTCGKEKYDYSGKNIFEKIITWIKSLLI